MNEFHWILNTENKLRIMMYKWNKDDALACIYYYNSHNKRTVKKKKGFHSVNEGC